MRCTTFHTLVLGVLIGLAPAAMPVGCGGETYVGTETGNPPFIDSLKLYLEQDGNGVRIIAGAGAITPAGARVRVMNLRTGLSIGASASTAGSLDVLIGGAPGDEYEVTVSSSGHEVSQLVSLAELAQRKDLGGVSCQALEATLTQTVSTTFSSAARGCTVAADCAYVGWGQGECISWCGGAVLSREGGFAARASVEERTASVCAALGNCEREPPPSCGGGNPFEVLECIDGQCQATDPVTLSCDELLEKTVRWYEDLVAAADRTCAVDADCRRVATPSASCISCGGWLALAGSAVATLETLVRTEVDQGLCRELSSRSCVLPEADCAEPSPGDAVCSNGTCILVEPPEPPPPQ